MRSSNTFANHAQETNLADWLSSVIVLAVWLSELHCLTLKNSKIRCMGTWRSARHTWATCTSRASWSQQVCGCSKAGRSLSYSISFKCLIARRSSRLLYIGSAKSKALNGSSMSYSSVHTKINMRHSTRHASKSAVTLLKTRKEAVHTYKWSQTFWASALTWTCSIALTWTSTSRRRAWIAWSVAQHIFCSWKTKTLWKWSRVDTKCSLVEKLNIILSVWLKPHTNCR